jgi:hypothetical protein
MKKLLFVGLISLSCATAHCQFVDFSIEAEVLKTSGGSPMPTSGLAVLVASTLDGSFGGPTDTSFASGSDDIVLKKWDLTTGLNQPGVLQDLSGTLPLSGNWDSGDLVQLYWFPTLTLASSVPGAGTSYGQYRDAVGGFESGGQIWTTPAPAATRFLKFFTTDATVLVAGGNSPASAGNASLTTVPEPSEYAMIFGMFCFAGALIRRSLKARSVRA